MKEREETCNVYNVYTSNINEKKSNGRKKLLFFLIYFLQKKKAIRMVTMNEKRKYRKSEI